MEEGIVYTAPCNGPKRMFGKTETKKAKGDFCLNRSFIISILALDPLFHANVITSRGISPKAVQYATVFLDSRA